MTLVGAPFAAGAATLSGRCATTRRAAGTALVYNSGPGCLGFLVFSRAVLRLMSGVLPPGNLRRFRRVNGFGLRGRGKSKCQQSKH